VASKKLNHFLWLLAFTVLSACYVVKKDVPRKIVAGPDGTIWLNNNLYLQPNEVTNSDWRQYLERLAEAYGKNSDEYKNALPDTTVWLKAPADLDMMTDMYLRLSYHANFPVVGVTYQQVQEYCAWKTTWVKTAIQGTRMEERLGSNFQFRLPTQTEWEIAAKAGLNGEEFPYGFEKPGEKSDLKIVCKDYYSNKVSTYKPVAATAMVPNRYNYYHMAGNVAEMTDQEGIAKGGSWNHTLKQCAVTATQTYDGPTFWLGFRLICEVQP